MPIVAHTFSKLKSQPVSSDANQPSTPSIRERLRASDSGLDEGSREGAAPFEVRHGLLEHGEGQLLGRAGAPRRWTVEGPRRAS
jgi:hypothetical protein